MNLSFEHKTALVCGSTQGIGKAVVEILAASGANVILLSRSEDKLEKYVEELRQRYPQSFSYIAVDLGDLSALELKLTEYRTELEVVDILVNNAGGPPPGTIEQASPSDFLSAFNQHLLANHIISGAVKEGMKKRGYGRIVNIISTSVKQPLKGLGVSNTIRAAVANWAKTLSFELASFGITVNNVLPGATSTERLQSILENKSKKSGASIAEVEEEMCKEIPAGRFGKPEEIASAVVFLCSEAASYINGLSMQVDGGRTSSH